MLHESDIMEALLHLLKLGLSCLNTFAFDYPDVPAGNENHFSEERFCKISFSLHHNVAHIISLRLVNLNIITYSHTEITVEK